MFHLTSHDRTGTATGLAGGVVLDEASIGRIEEWVVSTLDERQKPNVEAAWMDSLEGMTLTKRRGKAIDPTSSPTTPLVGWARFRLSRRRGIAIVSLIDQALIKEEDLDELTGDLLALVEAGHRRIVLDFYAVERLSSWAASVIDRTVRRCTTVEGNSIKFSGICPDVAAIFAMTGLDPRVATYPDTASAVAGVWPDLPELQPLPVSILTALMRAEEARPSRKGPRPGRDFRPSQDPSAMADEESLPMNRARLIVQDGPSMGRPVSIKGPKFVIGRGPDCQLKVGSATVSRRHATIERRGDRLFLRDLASTNGTSLNGRPVRDREVEIRDGDQIQVGKLSFSLAVDSHRGENLLSLSGPSNDRSRWDLEAHADSTEEYADLDHETETDGLKSEIIEGTLVVTPLTLELDDEAEIAALRDALIALGERKLPKRVVINLAHVNHLSSRAIGVLVAHHLRLDRSGGALRICLANPRVALLLEHVKLGMLVNYHPTVEEAVIAAWPDSGGLATEA